MRQTVTATLKKLAGCQCSVFDRYSRMMLRCENGVKKPLGSRLRGGRSPGLHTTAQRIQKLEHVKNAKLERREETVLVAIDSEEGTSGKKQLPDRGQRRRCMRTSRAVRSTGDRQAKNSCPHRIDVAIDRAPSFPTFLQQKPHFLIVAIFFRMYLKRIGG